MNKRIIGFAVALLLLFFLTIIVISNNFVIFAQSESMSDQMTVEQIRGGVSVSALSEWIGIFSIGMIVGLLAFKTSNSMNVENKARRRIIFSIAILSLAVGAIHLLLVPEHSKESIWWGLIFSITGIAQIGFGIVIVVVKSSQINILLYYIGIIGNALLVAIFILVRVFTPPFSPEGTPINELESNGVITLVIEIVIVILLTYVMKFKEEAKKILK
jgi:hypothetical protein